MCGHWWHICYRSLLAILRKKVGEPKEESRNLYGFTYVNSYMWIFRYNFVHVNSHIRIYLTTSCMWIRMIYEFTWYELYFPPLSIKVISMGMTSLSPRSWMTRSKCILRTWQNAEGSHHLNRESGRGLAVPDHPPSKSLLSMAQRTLYHLQWKIQLQLPPSIPPPLIISTSLGWMESSQNLWA